MRAMAPPIVTVPEILAACVLGIVENDLRQKIQQVEADLEQSATNYLNLARAERLFTIAANTQNDNDILVGAVTKGEIKSLYSYYLVEKSKPGRMHYDVLLAAAPSGVCPLCGAGVAITLDHYLPKAKFPIFSVLPNNLVPACRDCNTGKLTAFATAQGDQSLHPYFDHELLSSTQWLVAEVLHTSPASLRFSVEPPVDWDANKKRRVESHFTSLKLAPRFSVLAANELSSIVGVLNNYVSGMGPDAVKHYLTSYAQTEVARHRNSWKTAMYSALAASDWFCDVGFRSI